MHNQLDDPFCLFGLFLGKNVFCIFVQNEEQMC